MAVFLLFLILVVLLYATGLLPGVMKVISGLFACILLFVAAGMYGWPMVIGGFSAAIALAGLAVWLSIYSSSRIGRINTDDIHRQVAKANADEKRNRDYREAEKQRIIQEQINATDSVGSSPAASKMSDGDFEKPLEVVFSYQDQRDSVPRKQHVNIQRVSAKGDRVFFKAVCMKSGSTKMFMVDRIDGYITSSANGHLMNPIDYKQAKAFRNALLQLM